jgi:hypothetical protein
MNHASLFYGSLWNILDPFRSPLTILEKSSWGSKAVLFRRIKCSLWDEMNSTSCFSDKQGHVGVVKSMNIWIKNGCRYYSSLRIGGDDKDGCLPKHSQMLVWATCISLGVIYQLLLNSLAQFFLTLFFNKILLLLMYDSANYYASKISDLKLLSLSNA